ncbi:DUF7668 domain-containing protein [Paenibacillus turpanensis]|uniref:DUF7668 domain-containing protein n=1 Tax=Paenibacillus turpanensis TaxID=2689078 RepID=UPI00140B6C8C|nr:hypothetical protein [Paenibacillus turpanensis]
MLREQITARVKEAVEDLIALRFEKLKENKMLDDEGEALIKQVLELEGAFSEPSEEYSIDLYEYNDNSGFSIEVRYLWIDGEESQLYFEFEALTNADKTKVEKLYFKTVDA